MDTRYDTSNIPELGVLKGSTADDKHHIFNSGSGWVDIYSYGSCNISDHLKKVSLIASAHTVIHALIEMVNEEEQRLEEINAININMGLPLVEDGDVLKNARVALNSALGLKQDNATVQNIG